MMPGYPKVAQLQYVGVQSARPVQTVAITAHLTIVFAAPAVCRWIAIARH